MDEKEQMNTKERPEDAAHRFATRCRQLEEQCKYLQSRVKELEGQVWGMREALGKYVCHLPQCRSSECGVSEGKTWQDCSCGLTETLSSLPACSHEAALATLRKVAEAAKEALPLAENHIRCLIIGTSHYFDSQNKSETLKQALAEWEGEG